MKKISFKDHKLDITLDCEIVSEVENHPNFSIDFKFLTRQMTDFDYKKELIETSRQIRIVDEYYTDYEILNCQVDKHINYAIIDVAVLNPEYAHLVTGDAEETDDE